MVGFFFFFAGGVEEQEGGQGRTRTKKPSLLERHSSGECFGAVF